MEAVFPSWKPITWWREKCNFWVTGGRGGKQRKGASSGVEELTDILISGHLLLIASARCRSQGRQDKIFFVQSLSFLASIKILRIPGVFHQRQRRSAGEKGTSWGGTTCEGCREGSQLPVFLEKCQLATWQSWVRLGWLAEARCGEWMRGLLEVTDPWASAKLSRKS